MRALPRYEIQNSSYNPDVKGGDLLCTWTLDNSGKAVCDSAFDQESAAMHGIIGQGGKYYYPHQGELFLRNLAVDYSRSSMVSAFVIE